MYQLAPDCRPVGADKSQLFLRSCTSMPPTPENLRLVRSATTLVRSVLNGGDIAPLRDLLTGAEEWCGDVDDVLAVAGQSVIDEMDGLPRAGLHDVVRRVAQIERDVFAGSLRGLDGALRPALAG